MKRRIVFVVVAVLIITLAASVLITNSLLGGKDQAFYFGVTYCGDDPSEAKALIDRVKSYTNLFILQSGDLQKDVDAVVEIGEYAINSGLSFIAYFGSIETDKQYITSFLSRVSPWGDRFLGIYFDDEAGGKMLDKYNYKLYDQEANETITKLGGSQCSVTKSDGLIINYGDYTDNNLVYILRSDRSSVFYLNGEIGVNFNGTLYRVVNGTFYRQAANGAVDSKVENINGFPSVESYEEIMAKRPLQTPDEAAERLVNHIGTNIDWLQNQASVKTFTSDYALYWYDYLGGYDVVLAQLGWNQSTEQDLALVRGAANLQNKEWGAMITWKYTQFPYLAGREEIYQQMLMAYEGGADYIAVFNYAEDMQGTEGTLQEEHFVALERFWRDVVQNPKVQREHIEAEATFVLPKNSGWGLRRADDNEWGIWQPTSESQQMWANMQTALRVYNQKIDIVYDDPAYPVAGKYSQVIYWNQTP